MEIPTDFHESSWESDYVNGSHGEPPDDDVTVAIRDMNEKYAVVNEGGKAVIFKFGYDDMLKRSKIDRMSKEDLNVLYLNDKVCVGTNDDHKPVYKTRAALWLSHKHRRQYIEGVTFNPDNKTPRPGILNLWKGYSIEPRQGDWSIMKDLIRTILCDGDQVKHDYLMGWMARMIQFPAQQGEVAVVMKSGEGTGKGTLARALLKIIGQHGLAISNAKHLISNFNGHLRDAIFLFADEAFFAGDRAHVGVLKSIITEPYLTVEAKFQNAAQMPNFLHIMMASNEEWVIPASVDARRFFVLDVSEAVKNNHEYFRNLNDQMEAGGYEAMLYDLMHYDLSQFNVRDVPRTKGLQQQQKLSLSTVDLWWKECLDRGYVYKSKIGLSDTFHRWMDTISPDLLHASYLEFAEKRRERHPLGLEGITKYLIDQGCTKTRPTTGIVGEEIRDVPNAFGGTSRAACAIHKDRPRSLHLGSIDMARAGFSAKTHLTGDWGNDDDI